jgi:5-methylcytosine-specific restriction endonuclease McrA
MRPQRPCLDCGNPARDTRCRDCAKKRDAIYRGDYRLRSAIIRATARTCWLCGEGPRAGDPWTADHVVPHNAGSILRPAHRSCNSRRGNRS